jgi:hypothetical protein
MKKYAYDKESRQLRLPRRKRLRYALAREITRHFSTIEIEHRGGVVAFDDAEFAASYFAANEDAGLSLRYCKLIPWVCIELATAQEANAVASILGAATGHGEIVVETLSGFAVLHRVEAWLTNSVTERLIRVLSSRFPSAIIGPVERGQFLYVHEVVSLPTQFNDNLQTRINVTDVAKIAGVTR